MGTVTYEEWETEATKTTVVTGGTNFIGPYEADWQIAVTSTDQIAGRRQSGTSGVQFAVGGTQDGDQFTLWFIKDQPVPIDGHYYNEYTGQFTDGRTRMEGTWRDTHGNEGWFTGTLKSSAGPFANG